MRIELPRQVTQIIDTLTANGYEAYAVGGCVRDTMLKRVPGDWDITTSATPSQVKALFERTIDTGIVHGTVTVLIDHVGYEVTTYRVDGDYEDGRHPTSVSFTASLEEDLKRRDFTINAMAYNHIEGLVDCFEGQRDLQQKAIRCVGSAKERFLEDALRILRAIRFSAQLGFEVENETKEGIRALAENLKKISAERIQVEMTKLLMSPNPDTLRLAWELGVTKVILPEFDQIMETTQNNPHHDSTVGEHTLRTLTHVPQDRYLRWAMLLHDFGKPSCKTTDEKGIDHFYGHPAKSEALALKILRRLKLDNDTIRTVTRLVKWHDTPLGNTEKEVRKCMHKVGEDIYPMLFQVKYADLLGQSLYRREEKLSRLQHSRDLYEKVLENNDCVSLKTLAVTGKDLIELGVRPGPMMGKILSALLDEVLEDPQKNTKEYLIEKARKKL